MTLVGEELKSKLLHTWYMYFKSVAGTLKKLCKLKGDYLTKQRFSSFASLFKMGTSLKGKNLLPRGANYFH